MRTLVVVVLALLAAACERAPDAAPRVRATVESERAANAEAYRSSYAPKRDAVAAKSPGAWVAIVDGRVLPESPSLQEVDAAARRAAPRALHRFVFQVGEDGDVDWPIGATELKHVVGVRFIALLEDERVEMRALGPGQKISALFDGKLREITVPGPDQRMYVKPEVGALDEVATASELYCVSTGFAGTATLSSGTVKGLERWEIPGIARVHDANPAGHCRRARVRMRWTGSELDFTMAVAIWPDVK